MRLTAAGRTIWETITDFVEWNNQLDIYIPLYHWSTGIAVEIENSLVWNIIDEHMCFKRMESQVFVMTKKPIL